MNIFNMNPLSGLISKPNSTKVSVSPAISQQKRRQNGEYRSYEIFKLCYEASSNKEEFISLVNRCLPNQYEKSTLAMRYQEAGDSDIGKTSKFQGPFALFLENSDPERYTNHSYRKS